MNPKNNKTMTKEQEDKIIEQANKILEKRSMETIYFSETGGYDDKVTIHAYIIQPNGEKADYGRSGKISEFKCVLFDSVSFNANQLPREMLFSFRHGTSFFQVNKSLRGYKWKLEDLEYEPVDEKKWKEEQICIKMARKRIKGCKNIGDVYELYDKYLRNRPIPYDIIFEAFKIFKYEPNLNNYFKGEIGMFAFEQSFAFVSIMEGYKKENPNLK